MITRTSELAIKAMIYLALQRADEPLPPRQIAAVMGCSPSYLAKIMGDLARSGLLRGLRGVHGGVLLARAPREITLLDIVEACQGIEAGNYCRAIGDDPGPVCGFHEAMREVHLTTRKTLRSWTLAKLAAAPEPTGPLAGNRECRMAFLSGACSGGCGAGQKVSKRKINTTRKRKKR